MAPLLAGSLAQRDFEISGQRGRHSRAGRSVRAPAHLHLSAFVEQHACCSATPSTPIVIRRHSASQPAAGPTAAVFCFHPPTHPSAHQRLPLVMSSFVLLCSARTHSLSATPLCCCGTWSRPSAARHPLQPFPLSLCFLFFLFLVRLDPSGPLPLFLAGVRFRARPRLYSSARFINGFHTALTELY